MPGKGRFRCLAGRCAGRKRKILRVSPDRQRDKRRRVPFPINHHCSHCGNFFTESWNCLMAINRLVDERRSETRPTKERPHPPRTGETKGINIQRQGS